MKRNVLLVIFIAALSITSTGQIEMNSSGKVGVGSSPNSSFYLATPSAKIITAHFGSYGTKPMGAELYSDGESYFSGTYSTAKIKFESRVYYSSYYTRMVPTVNNQCDLGTNSYAFRKVYVYNVHELSDKRQKENIKSIDEALGIVLNLNGVRYDLKKEYAYDELLINDEIEKNDLDGDRKGNIGFLAQDVYDVLPEVVEYDDSADVYSVQYSRLIPVLVEAIKEQQAQIEVLENHVSLLSDPASKFKAASIGQELMMDQQGIASELFQNSPNPFSDETTIKYFLGENVNQASIIIYDMTGKQLKSFEVHHTGSGEINIFGGEFAAGMYNYCLIAEGTLIGSKQMILTAK